MKQRLWNTALTILPLLSGCSTLGYEPTVVADGGQAAARDRAAWSQAWTIPAEEPPKPVYSEDVGIVQSPTSGEVVASEHPGRDVPSGEGGRMYILELYQSALDEKENLLRQVDGLSAEREKLRQMLADSEKQVAERELQIGAIDAEKEALIQENQELAGRLITAQIRRLEAEKLLLEAKIEWVRAAERLKAEDMVSRAGDKP